MLEELVDLAKLQQGEPLALNLASVDLSALVARLVEERRQLSPEHALRLDAPAAPLVGEVDESRLARAVANLLSNASKYSASGTVISVRLAGTTDAGMHRAELDVEDQGMGIPAAELPHVGQRYFRASNAAGRADGTGLGLFGVRRIVEQHGGNVVIKSEEGRGTRVTVRLPLAGAGACAL